MKLLQPDICQNFYRYELVRRSGKYNMIMEARLAMIEAGLSAKDYADTIRHYSEYKSAIEDNFDSINNFMEVFRCDS
ncbi:hypothetical protein [Candidatus Nanosyncoccus alces]|uniref:Uncharacterized protein n=1 Tax=Candidatus Nanosyncoccus alces TaxID=2171997 RepID=A0ABY0FL00_9BACT|nr:hypothetical protein [Candidatus Nanosyncoccus alces]RYC74422.1 hypothetical protein G3RUM_00576 [Candidatus Nanosyncoccus alces]